MVNQLWSEGVIGGFDYDPKNLLRNVREMADDVPLLWRMRRCVECRDLMPRLEVLVSAFLTPTDLDPCPLSASVHSALIPHQQK